MTADIDLLPLPEGEASSFGNYEVHDNEAMIEYARANVARNTALLRAEIEALRAEVERVTCELMDATTRADKLAEALRRYRNEVPIGHQPHMLAHEVDDLLREQEDV